MRNIILIIFFALIHTTIGFAQTSFSCVYREYCYWNEYTEKFGSCEGYDESSLFVMNKTETMFTHTIESMKSTYYVNNRKYDEAKDVWLYYVTSDVGNEYIYIFDPKNKEIRALFAKGKKTIMIVFTVKAIF